MRKNWLRCIHAGAAAAACFASAPALAQSGSVEEVDAMVVASLDGQSGFDLARRQIQEEDYVGAASTLERVLLAHPEMNDARAVHAALLCRLDDPEGARLEIAALAGGAVSDGAWNDVTSACGSLPRPAPEAPR